MKDTDSTSEDTVATSDVTCILVLQITKEDDFIFDAGWNDSASIPILAKLIHAVMNTDLLVQQVREMEADEEDITKILEAIEEIDNSPIFNPSDLVQRNRSE